MDIMCGLPNDVLMNIIRMRLDEDRHKQLWSYVMTDLDRNGIYMLPCWTFGATERHTIHSLIPAYMTPTENVRRSFQTS